jgi:hypothetical protein
MDQVDFSAMSPSRKQPGVAFWATVVVIVVAFYIASIGPVRAIYVHGRAPEWTHLAIWRYHQPAMWVLARLPLAISRPFDLYIRKCYIWLDPNRRR